MDRSDRMMVLIKMGNHPTKTVYTDEDEVIMEDLKRKLGLTEKQARTTHATVEGKEIDIRKSYKANGIK